MNRLTLVDAVAKDAGLTKKKAEEAVKAVFENIKKELAAGGSFQLVGFGTFKVKVRPARKGTNPFTKKKMNIKAKKVPTFVAGKALKDAVAK